MVKLCFAAVPPDTYRIFRYLNSPHTLVKIQTLTCPLPIAE